eukprot:TRINITY_DN7244_c0_g1_i2.p1 TRINITY_DN7244_c0_g1~~TRINITY_DN7244_c0_g1_i2.p1  ORF type:complete len:250 (+),score=32.40 TRINITY_DN7244_c0_g1_i2:88-837(+)
MVAKRGLEDSQGFGVASRRDCSGLRAWRIWCERVALCLEVMAANGCYGIIRVPLDSDSRKAFARRCLDAGALGILFPNVTSAEQAKESIMNCYYPSAEGISGTRGYGYGGCNQDGAAFSAYTQQANQKIVIGVQLENKVAFEPSTLDAILKVPGLVFTQDGPYDHSGSYLVPGQAHDERVLADLERYRSACAKHGVVAGKHLVDPTEELVSRAIKEGYKFVAMGTDMCHVQRDAKRALDAAAKAQAGVQ